MRKTVKQKAILKAIHVLQHPQPEGSPDGEAQEENHRVALLEKLDRSLDDPPDPTVLELGQGVELVVEEGLGSDRREQVGDEDRRPLPDEVLHRGHQVLHQPQVLVQHQAGVAGLLGRPEVGVESVLDAEQVLGEVVAFWLRPL